MSDEKVNAILAGLAPDQRTDCERFMANWDFIHGRESSEDEAVRLEALKSYIEYGEG